MGVLYLVRHGQAPAHAYLDDAAPGYDGGTDSSAGLTDLGVAQARATGVALAGRLPRFDAAISGDLPRQRATLAAVLEAFPGSAAPTVDRDWNEYVTPPVPEAADMHAGGGAQFQDALDTALAAWVGGADIGPETYASFAARTRAAADRAAALAGSSQNVLVVSSAGTITQVIAQLWKIPSASWPNMSRTFVNSSITKILVGRRGMTLVSFNEHAHVAGEALFSYR